MELTIGFVALFTMLVLPGMIFRRLYFRGEFSKQVSTSEPVLQTLAYSLIPGFLIQYACFFGFHKALGPIDLDSILLLFKSLLSNSVEPGNPNQKYSLGAILEQDFILYTVTLYSISGTLGLLTSMLVRITGFDKRFKLLRYRNQWAYIFSGEILITPKFRKAISQDEYRKHVNSLSYLFPHVDVLVNVGGEKTILYKGIVVDYELNSKEYHVIDRLYLRNARRYKKTNNGTEPKIIPGDFLVILGKDIVNMNVNYFYSQVQQRQFDATKKILNIRDALLVRYQQIVGIFVAVLLLVLLIDPHGLIHDLFIDLSHANWILKIIFWYILSIAIFNLLFPFHKVGMVDKKFRFVGFKKWITRVLISGLILAIYWVWVIN